MGQYYMPCVLRKNWKLTKNVNPVLKTVKCYDFNNGAKLMEHSYVGNSFVHEVVQLLSLNRYGGYPFVWSGDYADTELFRKKLNYDGDIFKNENHTLYTFANCLNYKEKHTPITENRIFGKYIINFTTHEFVEVKEPQQGKWLIHPLPLLCSDGNGRGGGDYYGSNMDFVGLWAFNSIGCTDNKKDIPKGFKRLKIKFVEGDCEE